MNKNTRILFFAEKIRFAITKKRLIREWLYYIIESEGYKLSNLNFIFCTDNYLHKLNLQYLNHNTYTDIITFDNSNVEGTVEGDIFISIERVRENAKSLGINFSTELHRVIAHGVLHLCNYRDKTPKAKKEMTSKEDYYLSLRPFL